MGGGLWSWMIGISDSDIWWLVMEAVNHILSMMEFRNSTTSTRLTLIS